MKKAILIPIIIGSVLLVVGGTIFAIGVGMNNASSKVVEKEYEIDEFNKLNIDVDTADINFQVTTDGTRKVVVKEREKQYHTVNVENDTLNIKGIDDRKWYEYAFNFSWTDMKLTIYCPATDFADSVIKSSTGDINIPKEYNFTTLTAKLSTGNLKINSANINNLDVSVSTGKVTVETNSKDMKIRTSTGDVHLNNTIIENHLDIETSTGDVKINDSDAKTINIKTSTGDVRATLLTGKTFEVETTTGSKHYPESTVGAGLCKVKTSTGNIYISIK